MQHHAYYIEGAQADFEDLKVELKPFYTWQFERFGIDEARELIALSSFKNIDTSLFLIGAASITTEAQQALLKLFEEPQKGVVFVLLIPHGTLLPTLKSRMLPYEKQQLVQKSSATPFLTASSKERSEIIAKLLKDEEGVRERVRDFLNGLEYSLSKKMSDKQVRDGLEDIAKVRSYVADRSPSFKMLLEHLALSLPVVR